MITAELEKMGRTATAPSALWKGLRIRRGNSKAFDNRKNVTFKQNDDEDHYILTMRQGPLSELPVGKPYKRQLSLHMANS